MLTTSGKEIQKYLKKHDEIVIITTYQSSNILADSCQKIDYKLDLIIFDEAHKTVGSVDKLFAYLLDDKNISTKKKLFTTATEKVYTGDNDEILSMDNTGIYGKVIYNYSFKSAIE